MKICIQLLGKAIRYIMFLSAAFCTQSSQFVTIFLFSHASQILGFSYAPLNIARLEKIQPKTNKDFYVAGCLRLPFLFASSQHGETHHNNLQSHTHRIFFLQLNQQGFNTYFVRSKKSNIHTYYYLCAQAPKLDFILLIDMPLRPSTEYPDSASGLVTYYDSDAMILYVSGKTVRRRSDECVDTELAIQLGL